MHKMLPRLLATDFPAIRRAPLQTLQVNLGYKCNQACYHCHVNASPRRREMMDADTIEHVLAFLRRSGAQSLDLTGGAPEMNPHFKHLVSAARALGVQVTDRCNLTILEEPGYADMAAFLAAQRVDVVASLPCYLEDNVDEQRGDGVFQASLSGLRQLNALGYGQAGSGLSLNLVYNPVGAFLPPAQAELERSYKTELHARYGIHFNHLYTITNMPIARFGSTLVEKGELTSYMNLLKDNYNPASLKEVMCRSTLSIDYQGYVYDCDFNQMLAIPLGASDQQRTHLSELHATELNGQPIAIADHCYGCTAGQGSSCGGALA
ncbi:MAG: radical SAM protein [Gammaproteobacteria bacterium]|nr:MAG: radical SAM protein [Gammaproteobacteria bacterium]